MPEVNSFLLATQEKEITRIRGSMGMLNLLRTRRVKLSWPRSYFISGSYNNEHGIDFLLQRRHRKNNTHFVAQQHHLKKEPNRLHGFKAASIYQQDYEIYKALLMTYMLTFLIHALRLQLVPCAPSLTLTFRVKIL